MNRGMQPCHPRLIDERIREVHRVEHRHVVERYTDESRKPRDLDQKTRTKIGSSTRSSPDRRRERRTPADRATPTVNTLTMVTATKARRLIGRESGSASSTAPGQNTDEASTVVAIAATITRRRVRCSASSQTTATATGATGNPAIERPRLIPVSTPGWLTWYRTGLKRSSKRPIPDHHRRDSSRSHRRRR